MLSTLPKIIHKKKKRLGRGLGSGVGAKSGRGTTRHQKAREDIPLHFEGGQGKFVKKFPLIRGKGRNKPLSPAAKVVTLEDLNKFEENEVVTFEALVQKKIVDQSTVNVKILANGNLTKKLTVAIPVSQSAKKLIEEAGGKIQTA